ncbi:MAG: HlyD family secretion protein [Chthoniobacteraceae bacterium]
MNTTSYPEEEVLMVDGGETAPGKIPGKRIALAAVGVIVILALCGVGLYFRADAINYESTDDAFVEGHVIQVSSKIAGRVERVLVDDNQEVKKGDTILEIDPRDYAAQLKQKQAALESMKAQATAAQAAVEQQLANARSLQATLKQDEADQHASEAQAHQSADDLRRVQDLAKQHIVSAQDLVHAQDTDRSAQANVESAKMKVLAAEAQVSQGEAQVRSYQALYQYVLAQIKENEANVEAALLNHSYAKVAASESGRITHKSVEPGDYIQVGQNVLALIPSNLWITANFKENQLRWMRPGQPVTIKLDALGAQEFKGHVDSIQMGSGARFSLLPAENASGNYVKVVQRVPVKILFDELPETGLPIGPGESVVPTVKVQDFHYTPLELSLVMAAAAVVIAVFLRRIFGVQKKLEQELAPNARQGASTDDTELEADR